MVGRVVASGPFHLRTNVFGQEVGLFEVTVSGKQAACFLREMPVQAVSRPTSVTCFTPVLVCFVWLGQTP